MTSAFVNGVHEQLAFAVSDDGAFEMPQLVPANLITESELGALVAEGRVMRLCDYATKLVCLLDMLDEDARGEIDVHFWQRHKGELGPLPDELQGTYGSKAGLDRARRAALELDSPERRAAELAIFREVYDGGLLSRIEPDENWIVAYVGEIFRKEFLLQYGGRDAHRTANRRALRGTLSAYLRDEPR